MIEYKKCGDIARLAIPTSEHYNPILFILGASDEKDEIAIFNEACVYGSLSMTSYIFQNRK